MARHHGGHGSLHGVFVADVEGNGLALAAVLANFLGHAVQFFGGAPADDNPRAQRGQFVRGAAANAAAAACDPDGTAGKQAGPEDALVVARGRGETLRG
jgi:hypothetical protein